MTNITLHEKHETFVSTAKEVVQEIAPISWITLFEGDRWSPIQRVAIATANEAIVGLASLAPHGEQDRIEDSPAIIGIWVRPDCRRQGVGLSLVKALCDDISEDVSFEGVSPSGLALAKKAQEMGYPLRVKGLGFVPLP